ncbi:hypothetical protein BCR39DRAFT_546465 [Naematelia encephala]|uniref:LamB/YcsF family protein n=1 Tax=Naematelia encephala TaxID=71784 RepID=A0A1Y2AQI3_9TREE|nr:hypothetical protein BCR39DRAFT_546465 [Naematelia encephala]
MVHISPPRIEINCDMGEAFGPYPGGPDEEIMPFIDTANVACGGHSGDPVTMLKTVQLAKKHGVRVGAHPGYPDLLGFGRRSWEMSETELYCMILTQVGALKAVAESEGLSLNHIKPHGRLYTTIASERDLCRPVYKACKTFNVPVYGLPGSFHESVAAELGIDFIPEVYVDANYVSAYTLINKLDKTIPPLQRGDLYTKVKQMRDDDSVIAVSGRTVPMGIKSRPFTICIHSDIPDAIHNVSALQDAVKELNA